MRGVKAKAIRRAVYGDISIRAARSYGIKRWVKKVFKGRTYDVHTGARVQGLRGTYQKVKAALQHRQWQQDLRVLTTTFSTATNNHAKACERMVEQCMRTHGIRR